MLYCRTFGVFNTALFQGYSALIGQFTRRSLSVKNKRDRTWWGFFIFSSSPGTLRLHANLYMLLHRRYLNSEGTLERCGPAPTLPHISFMYPQPDLSHSWDNALIRGGMKASRGECSSCVS